jgi:hypothetical protein
MARKTDGKGKSEQLDMAMAGSKPRIPGGIALAREAKSLKQWPGHRKAGRAKRR